MGSLFSAYDKKTYLSSGVFGKFVHIMHLSCIIISVITATWMHEFCCADSDTYQANIR